MELRNKATRNIEKKVGLYLSELFEDGIYHEKESGHFYVTFGSTVLEISVEAHEADEVLVMVMAYCVQGVEVDEELLRGLMELNHDLPFGAFSLVGNDIFFQYALFGGTLERSNLLNAITAVATISDDYDDPIVKKYGGERALDRIRQTGGRARRRNRPKVDVGG